MILKSLCCLPRHQHLLLSSWLFSDIYRQNHVFINPEDNQLWTERRTDWPSWSASSPSSVWRPRRRHCWWIRPFSPVWCEESATGLDSSSSSSPSNHTPTSASSRPRSAAASPPSETPAEDGTTSTKTRWERDKSSDCWIKQILVLNLITCWVQTVCTWCVCVCVTWCVLAFSSRSTMVSNCRGLISIFLFSLLSRVSSSESMS